MASADMVVKIVVPRAESSVLACFMARHLRQAAARVT
jgi:hypothetical protein